MPTVYSVISDDFEQELDSIRRLLDAFDGPNKGTPRVRIAAANAATLLLAATFEEYVREMGKAFAKQVVGKARRFSELPGRLATRAWRRTLDTLSRLRVDGTQMFLSAERGSVDPRARFDDVWAFCKGDLSRDIYDDLTHNENNMRVGEINSVFSVCGLSDACRKACDKTPLHGYFSENEGGKIHGLFVDRIEEFFNRRNMIAHAINSGQSSSPESIRKELDLFHAFGKSLCEMLEAV